MLGERRKNNGIAHKLKVTMFWYLINSVFSSSIFDRLQRGWTAWLYIQELGWDYQGLQLLYPCNCFTFATILFQVHLFECTFFCWWKLWPSVIIITCVWVCVCMCVSLLWCSACEQYLSNRTISITSHIYLYICNTLDTVQQFTDYGWWSENIVVKELRTLGNLIWNIRTMNFQVTGTVATVRMFRV